MKEKGKKVHFIAIGGSVMHNLALCLDELGYEVSGSDDIIYDPARSRLAEKGLLPKKEGWDPNSLDEEVSWVILGMHAKEDNPELQKALQLGIEIYSFPEFIGNWSRDKRRVVVAGSHGKTTTTSMIMHVLKELGRDFDYLVGAQLKGFDLMVRLTDAPDIILEGDEYLSSALDGLPKFMHYKPEICVLTGLAWDHINVFPTYASYLQAFEDLLLSLTEQAVLIYNGYDPEVKKFVSNLALKCRVTDYAQAEWTQDEEEGWLLRAENTMDLDAVHWQIMGEHNVINAMGALRALEYLGVSIQDAMHQMATFSLPDKRLDLIMSSDTLILYKDFAHAPSKVRASVRSIRDYARHRRLIVVVELHTYSSLNKDFLPLYKDSLDTADRAFVYYNPRNLEVKRLSYIDEKEIRAGFNRPDLEVHTHSATLFEGVKASLSGNDLVLLMSSSNFGSIDWLKLNE